MIASDYSDDVDVAKFSFLVEEVEQEDKEGKGEEEYYEEYYNYNDIGLI